MPTFGQAFSSRLAASRKRGGAQASIPELQQQAALLRQEQQQFNAPQIEGDRPSLFMRIVDFLSRPNYAVAGAAEEILSGAGITKAFARGVNELLSGLPGMEGQKRAWGQVLEQQGFGTVTVGDIVPFMDGTWVGNFGSRGAAGLALDIFTDPLTYITFGTSGAVRLVTGTGRTISLNTRGIKALEAVRKEMQPVLDDALKRIGDSPFDAFKRAEEAEKFFRKVDDEFLKRITDTAGKVVDESVVDQGGIKLFGSTIVPGRKLAGAANAVGAPFTYVLSKMPGGEALIDSTRAFGKAFTQHTRRLFHPQGDLANLPPEMRARAIRNKQNFVRAYSGIQGRLSTLLDAGHIVDGQAKIVPKLRAKWDRLAKSDPDIGKKFYDIREGSTFYNGTPLTVDDLTAAEREVYDSFVYLYDQMGFTLGNADIITPRANYFYHRYSDESMQQLKLFRADHMGGAGPDHKLSSTFTKERRFDTFEETVRYSKKRNADTLSLNKRNQAQPIHPILEPDFNLMRSTEEYIGKYAQTLARKSWREQTFLDFGVAIDKFDLDAYFDLNRPALAVRPRAEILRDIDEQQALLNRAREAGPVDPDSPFAKQVEQRKARIAELEKMIADPDYGMSKSEIAAVRKLEGEEADEFRRARANRIERHKAELRELKEQQRSEFLETGQPWTADEIADAEDRLKRLRGELKDGGVGDLNKIDLFFGSNKTLRDIEKEFRESYETVVDDFGKDKTVLRKGAKGEADSKVRADIRRTYDSLSTDDGKREFMRRLLLATRSPSQYYSIMDDIIDDAWEFLPDHRVVMAGDVDPTIVKWHGTEGARYRPVTGKFVEEAGYERGIMLPEYIWDDISRVNSRLLNTDQYDTVRRMLRGFDWLNNTFKLGVYTFWPASLVRDAYSNVFLSGLEIGINALDPKLHKHATAITAILGTKGAARRRLLETHGDMVFETAGGVKWRVRDLVDMAENFNVYIPGRAFSDVVDNPTSVSKVGKALRGMADKRGLIENEQRLVLWLSSIRKGIDPRRSMERVSEFLFQYGELSPFEREFMRRLIPFYSFTRFNVALQAKALTKTPGRVINQIKPFRPRNDEQEMMVKWEAGSLGIRLDRDGKTVHMLQGIDLPLRNLDTLWTGTLTGSARRILGMVTPIIKTPLEVATGRDPFTGGDLTRATGPTVGRIIDMTDPPKAVKDWLGYKKEYDEAGRPKYTFDGLRYSMLVRSWAFSRVFTTSDRQFREYLAQGDFDTQAALLDFFTGIRSKQLNMEDQQRRKLTRIIRELESSLARRGRRGEFRKQFTPKDIGEAEFE